MHWEWELPAVGHNRSKAFFLKKKNARKLIKKRKLLAFCSTSLTSFLAGEKEKKNMRYSKRKGKKRKDGELKRVFNIIFILIIKCSLCYRWMDAFCQASI